MSLTNSVTWWITDPCPANPDYRLHCEYSNITDYDQPTPVILCVPHGECVGHVVHPLKIETVADNV